MGQTPPNARRATDVLQCDEAKTAGNDGYTALAGGDDAATSKWVPSHGRIARFARGKAAIFGSSDKLKPGSWLLYHGFVMLDVVWEKDTSDNTIADDAAVVATLVKSEAGAGVAADASGASTTTAATATATGKVLHREFWRIEFNHRCRVWMTKFDVLPEPYAAALHWEIPPVERRMSSLPARQAGLFDARYNNSQHYQQRVLRFLRGRRRQPPSEWFKFWKWGSNCGGDVDTAPATATAADPKSEAAAADSSADDKDDASEKEADEDHTTATAATTTIDEVPPTDAAVSSSTAAAATCGLRRRHQRRAAAAANACGVFEPTAMPARAAGPAPLAAPSTPSLRYYPAPTAEPPTAAYAFGRGVGAGAGAGAGVGAGAGATYLPEAHSVVHRPDYYEVLLPTAPTSEAVGAHGVVDAVSSSGGGAAHRRQLQGMEPATSCAPRAHDPRTSHGSAKRLPMLHAVGRRSRPRTPMRRARRAARHGHASVRSAVLRLL